MLGATMETKHALDAVSAQLPCSWGSKTLRHKTGIHTGQTDNYHPRAAVACVLNTSFSSFGTETAQ